MSSSLKRFMLSFRYVYSCLRFPRLSSHPMKGTQCRTNHFAGGKSGKPSSSTARRAPPLRRPAISLIALALSGTFLMTNAIVAPSNLVPSGTLEARSSASPMTSDTLLSRPAFTTFSRPIEIMPSLGSTPNTRLLPISPPLPLLRKCEAMASATSAVPVPTSSTLSPDLSMRESIILFLQAASLFIVRALLTKSYLGATLSNILPDPSFTPCPASGCVPNW
mmetsp:Transcript_24539/g.56873  ORF Transcript_24539/g.56873 Transcript_24539/m.56873 type:complete len:221 (+) Transcript_24539:136-798(+)